MSLSVLNMKSENRKSLLIIYLVIMSPGQKKQSALGTRMVAIFTLEGGGLGTIYILSFPLSLDPELGNNWSRRAPSFIRGSKVYRRFNWRNPQAMHCFSVWLLTLTVILSGKLLTLSRYMYLAAFFSSLAKNWTFNLGVCWGYLGLQ